MSDRAALPEGWLVIIHRVSLINYFERKIVDVIKRVRPNRVIRSVRRTRMQQMTRQDVTLLMLALADEGGQYSPVQIQKALFLASREAGEIFDDDSRFHFKPYDYGPFDREVYVVLEALSRDGLVEIGVTPQLNRKTYAASAAGRRAAKSLLKGLSKSQAEFIQTISRFVRRLSFSDLVSAIYKAYPEMKEKSVFIGG